MEKTTLQRLRDILAPVLIVVLLVLGVKYSIQCFGKLEHYSRVYQNPLKVTAVVVEHEVDEGTDDTDYWAIAQYEVDGKSYKIRFERTTAASKLTPVGTEVTLEVSPEDPSVQVFRLESEGSIACLVIILLGSSLLSAIWRGIICGRRSKGGTIPSRETARRDLLLTVVANPGLLLPLLFAVGLVALILRYPAVYGTKTAVAAGISMVIWVAIATGTVRACRKINQGGYTLRRDTLVEKKMDLSGDSTTYELVFKAGDGSGTWKTTATAEAYKWAAEGDTVTSVSMDGWRKPLLRYNKGGVVE